MADVILVGGMQMRRLDLGAIRKKIHIALGPEKMRSYWDIVRRFTQFRLSKEELDVSAREVLGPDNVSLHNNLIRAIFQNAVVGTVNPPEVEVVPAPFPDDSEPTRPNKKSKKKGHAVATGQANALGAQGKLSILQRRDVERPSHETIWLNAHETHRTQWKICDGADLYDESLELPSIVDVRNALKRRCQECNLTFEQDTVECLHVSLERYMKNMISTLSTISKLRRGVCKHEADKEDNWITITPSDLLTAFNLEPQLLGNDWSLNAERITIIQQF
ncbi:hypothetical protein GUITHDRAFT_166583 [Guillardia theta CCMP2712]|uniref:Uncharacterized protein n=1 Tax=Guillardia theta (strain CCMP2712) TaxID=905079 RepID=L1I9L4_GUITC|nr:hypothetical protein GUITHDRAFT_166583 [Guillardia theta CCMP2712]EKX32941.1 hypothetical protein GUITHDRAFT_166583 [Guillardia theta CCMP2712]|eukprot:XP_005819921.1 hypothetical protein GUITHDRAFT_166583 [Guillardia theta CCMP2712]